MSIECGECEQNVYQGHAPDCSRNKPREPKKFEREERYVVFKLSDVRHLSYFQREMLEHLQESVCNIRDHLHKTELVCVVIESDWTEYEPVWEMIEERMKDKS